VRVRNFKLTEESEMQRYLQVSAHQTDLHEAGRVSGLEGKAGAAAPSDVVCVYCKQRFRTRDYIIYGYALKQ